MAIGTLVSQLVIDIVMIFLGALLLMISTKIFKTSDSSYMSALKITAILGVISIVGSIIGNFVPTIAAIISYLVLGLGNIVLAVWLIKRNYSLEWGKAILVWLVWFVLSIIAAIIIGMIVAVILVAIGISAIAAA